MSGKNNNFDNKVNQIINELQDLDTVEIQEKINSGTGINELSNILNNISLNPESAIGTEIGQWKILSLLGIGGMSIVYLVERNDKQLKQKAALKIIPNTIASETMIERFIRERQILSDLNHNNIAKLYDAGITEQNVPWLVMELVEGEDILMFSESNKLDLEQRIILFKQACEALSYAHSQGVIHRDIKPSNLLVNHNNILKLLDFGIATVEEQQSLTMTGAVIGTPGYMSPEQAKGMSSTLDRRTDVFSLGVLLYKLINYTMPFKAENISDISHKIIHDEPATLSSDIPVEIQAITFKCLEKKVENRYASINELNQDLSAYLKGDVVSAKKITTLGRLRKKIKKHPVMSSLIAIAIAATFMGIGYGISQSIALQSKIQTAEKYLSRSQEIRSKIRRTHTLPLHNIQSEYKQISEQIEQLRNEIESADADLTGLSHFALGSAYLSMRQNDFAYKYLIQSEEKGWKSPELYSSLGLLLSQKWQEKKQKSLSFSDSKEQQNYLSKYKISLYQPAIKYLQKAGEGLSTSNYVSAYLAHISTNLDAAIESIEKEITLNPWHYEAFSLASNIYAEKAIQIISDQSYQKAKKFLDLSNTRMAQAIDIGRSDPHNYAEYCANLGTEIQFKLLYQADSLVETFDKGLVVCNNALLLAVSPKPAIIYHNLGYLYSHFAEYQELNDQDSVALYKKSYDILKKGIIEHPNDSGLLMATVSPLTAMAKNQVQLNQSPGTFYNTALNNIELSLKINSSQRKTWNQLAILQKNVGNFYKSKGDYQQANQLYAKSILSHKKVIELGSKLSGLANIALVLNEQAKLKLLQGHTQEGIDLFRQALTTSEEIFVFNTDIFVIYSNYFEYQFELLKALKENNLPYEKELSKAINSINQGCQLTYLKQSHYKTIKEFIDLLVDNQYARLQDFYACQDKLMP